MRRITHLSRSNSQLRSFTVLSLSGQKPVIRQPFEYKLYVLNEVEDTSLLLGYSTALSQTKNGLSFKLMETARKYTSCISMENIIGRVTIDV
jgi:hypothetical protein